MTDILALDIATTCGFARGLVGGVPDSGSICFARSEASSDNAIFGNALAWISQLLEPAPRPDILIVEEMLPPDAMKGKTSKAVRDRLAGLHGVIRGVAHLRGIYRIDEATVGTVRAHFIGDRTCKRTIAKRETIAVCERLGWPCADDNAADALALWSYACARIDPKLALQVSPLFRKREVAA
jgi:crossover junction endodeoxyribonuclease RuvC